MGVMAKLNMDVANVAPQKVVSGGGVVDSGVYSLAVVDAYMYKSKNGKTTKLNVKYKATDGDEREFFTDVNILGEDNLPYKSEKGDWTSIDGLANLLKSCGLADSEQTDGEVEFGTDKVKVSRLVDLVGKNFIGGVRKVENNYNADKVPFINEVEQYFTPNYHTSEDDTARMNDFKALIEKTPIKPAKGKKAGGTGSAPAAAQPKASADVAALV